jgi:dihydrofolate reductase
MGKVVVDLTMSLDGFIAGPDDGPKHPLGQRDGQRLFDWYFNGPASVHGELFRPRGRNIAVVDELFETTGAMLYGRRTYDITGGWKGTHPIRAVPIFVLTHRIPDKVPEGQSKIVFITDGILSALDKARAAAGPKDVRIGGASASQQALAAGLVDELYIHLAPILLGEGVRLFEQLGASSIKLERIAVISAPEVMHLRYRVLRA